MGAAVNDGQNINKKFVRQRKAGSRTKFPNRNQNLTLLGPCNMRPRAPFQMGRMPPPSLGMRQMPPGPLGPPPPGLRPPPPPMRGGRMPPPNRIPPYAQRGPPPLLRPPPNVGPCMRPPPPPPHMMRPMGPPMMPPPPPGPRGPGFRRPPQLLMKQRRTQKGRVVKKKRLSLKDMDLAKPWVTEQIREEFNKKDRLLQSAKATQKPVDWSQYRDQREKCSKLYTTAKLKYDGQHPGEVDFHLEETSDDDDDDEEIDWETDEPFVHSSNTAHEETYRCDPCDKSFYSVYAYEKHVSQHRPCGIDGCEFVAHPTVIEWHIANQHVTGLYERINDKNTPEALEKWLRDRKNRYPTLRNVRIKRKMMEARTERGERLHGDAKKRRFDGTLKSRKGRAGTKAGKSKRNKRAKVDHANSNIPSETKASTLIDERSDWNGKMFPFRGTRTLYKLPEDAIERSEFDDAEWSFESNSDDEDAKSESPKECKTEPQTNALGFLMGYCSDSDNSEEDQQSSSKIVSEKDVNSSNLNEKETITSCLHEDDDGPPLEEKTVRKKDVDEEIVCKVESIKLEERNKKKVKPKKTNKKQGAKVYSKRHRPTLLERLLKDEIRHERNVLLQCVRYVVNKNFFQ